MKEEILQNTNTTQGEDNSINLMDFLRMGLANWYWFVLSVIVCLGGAFVYLKSTPKIYMRTASVLIKDEKRGGMASEASAFEDLNLMSFKSNVDNELLVFKARRLMDEVVRRLQLDISYKVKNGLIRQELYTASPLTVQFPDVSESQIFNFVITPVSDKEVLLSDFEMGENFESRPIKVQLNDTVTTPVGKVVVVPTLHYSKNCYGIPLYVGKSNLRMVSLGYTNSLQLALANKASTIINLSLSDVSPRRAEDVINTLIDVYNEDAVNDKNQVAINTSNFINERLIIIEKELGGVDSEIENYKKENRLTDITSETGVYLQTSTQNQQVGLDMENQLTLTRYIREYLTDPTKGTELIPTNTGIGNMDIETQISKYNDMLLKRNKLVSNSSENNPVVMDLNNALDAMRQTIVRTVDNQITAYNVKIRNVREQEAQISRRIAAVPTQQKYVLSVERQQKIKEELYLYLLNKREENALSQSITESNARVVDAATGSDAPVAPKAMMIIMAALALGCVIPAGVLYLITIMDTKVRDRKEIEDNLTAPFLGEIPYREREKGEKGEKDNTLVIRENGRDSVSEAFRIVRTNMEFMRVGVENLQVVMFTSLNVSEGKTFISSNLAVSLAMTGKKVVIVDLDIRKGTLSSHIRTADMGVTNYLSGKVDDVGIIVRDSGLHPNLDIVCNGPIPPNPAEFLLSKRLDKLVDELRKRYDYVLLDNVPSNMIADAVIVGRLVDLTIYVIRAGYMDRRQLPEVEKLYRQKKFKNMAILLNGVKYKHTRYGYYKYGYYGSYGYSYGYGYDPDKKKKH